MVYQRKIGIRDLQNSESVLEEFNELREENKAEFDEVKGSIDSGILTIEGIRNTNEDIPGIGGGFRYCTLGTPLFNEFGDIDSAVLRVSLPSPPDKAQGCVRVPPQQRTSSSDQFGVCGDAENLQPFPHGPIKARETFSHEETEQMGTTTVRLMVGFCIKT